MAFFDSAADIKIYNYKTREIFSEKCLMAFHKGTNTVAAVGEECTNFSPNDDRVDLCLPIVMGKLANYTAAHMLFKYFIQKYIYTINGKRILLRRSTKALIFLHEPCSEVDMKMYNDLLYSLGYKEIFIITAETELNGLTVEEAIWRSEEVHGKLDCAIEIGKDDKYQYARYAYEQLKKDYKRWGYDMDVIKDFE